MTITAQLRANAHSLTQQLFSCRELISQRHDVLWRIERGVVRTLTWSEEGTAITLGFWGPGDVVGYPLSRVKPYQIECLTSVEMSLLPEVLWCQVLDAIVCHTQQTEELLSIVCQNPTSLRLWQFLVWLADKFGRDVEQGRLIELRITQQDMAEAVNMTRVTVTRTLQQFESEGRLCRRQRQLILSRHN